MNTPSSLSSLSPPPSLSGPAAPQAAARPAEPGQEPFRQTLAREVATPSGAASGTTPAPGKPDAATGNSAAEKASSGKTAADDAGADQGEELIMTAGPGDAAALAQFLVLAAQVAQAAQAAPAARPQGKGQAAAGALSLTEGDGAADARFAATAGAALVPGEPDLQALPDDATPGVLAAAAAHPDRLAPGAAEPSLPAFSALAPARAVQPHAAAADALPQAARLAPQVGAPGWDQALGQRVVWMAGNGQHSASLILNPPELGPLQVVLNVADSQATANFFAAQPEVRQALEAAMPRLREMLDAAGIELGQASVSSGGGQQAEMGDGAPRGGRDGGDGSGASAMETAQAGNGVAGAAVSVAHQGLVNTFA